MIDTKEMEKLPEGWKRIKLGKVLDYEQPINYIVKSENYDQKSGIPVLTAGKTFILGYTDETEGVFKDVPVIIFDDFTTESKFINFSFKVKSSALKILKLGYDRNNIYFLYNAMQILNFNPGSEHKRYWISEYSNTVIPLPSLPEQEKIAEILETVDNTIEKTDAIIEKYKRTKQGLMQELLTKGIDINWHIRSEKTHQFKDSPLGRIPADWEVKKLGEIGKSFAGGTPSSGISEYYNGDIKWLKSGEINSKYIYNTEETLTSSGLRNSNAKWIEGNTVVIAMYGATAGQVGIVKTKMTANQAVLALSINEKERVYFEYLYYSLLVSVNLLLSNLQGSGQPNLNKGNIDNLIIALPPLPEQERIASVLSQVDTVIEKETAYRDKLSRIKQGLMEDLLTGKVRVTTLLENKNNQYQKEVL